MLAVPFLPVRVAIQLVIAQKGEDVVNFFLPHDATQSNSQDVAARDHHFQGARLDRKHVKAFDLESVRSGCDLINYAYPVIWIDDFITDLKTGHACHNFLWIKPVSQPSNQEANHARAYAVKVNTVKHNPKGAGEG